MGEAAETGNGLTDVATTWATGLAGVTGEQMATGLHACINRADAWPPTLPEFRSMCLNLKTGLNEFGLDYIPECYRAAPIVDRSKLLPSDERNASRTGLAEKMVAMKAALK